MSATSKRVRAAVVGLGEMGTRHARVLASMARRFELIGIVDTRRDVARAAARRFEAPALDLDEAIARAELVVFATPIDAHAAGAARALAAGRHVLVEKPICGRVADARRLVRLAQGARVQLFVGHSERFNPVVRALAALVPPAEVRALEHVRLGPPRGTAGHGGSALLNLGIHDVDLAAFLGGAAADLVRAEGSLDHADLTLAVGATHARIAIDRAAPDRRRGIRVVTDDAVYEGDLLAHRLACGGEVLPLADEEPLAAQALAIHGALEGLASAAATGEDGARALAIVEDAQARLGAGEPLRLAAEKL
jgi:predicted dehydrogenase